MLLPSANTWGGGSRLVACNLYMYVMCQEHGSHRNIGDVSRKGCGRPGLEG